MVSLLNWIRVHNIINYTCIDELLSSEVDLIVRRVVMPYKTVSDLPDRVTNHLPQHGQEIYLKAFNSAWDEYADASRRRGNETREETAHKVAWSAVENVYEKDKESGNWKLKRNTDPQK